MTLQDVIDQLADGELNNIFVLDTDTQDVDEKSKGRVITHLNLGLAQLHKRFFIKERVEVVNLVPDQLEYVLQAQDLLRIEKVEDLEDNEYLVDVDNEPESLQTRDYRTLVVPKDIEATSLKVTYRANHGKIGSLVRFQPADAIIVDLPIMYLDSLVLFIASRFLNPMGASEGMHEGNNYAARYEQSCQLLEMQNYDIDRSDLDFKFHNAGWV